ncbi:MAG: DEAD/DEAH box helicase family protein [Deltaproteobacteria bacterium]|nr:DEAD/DEAH box helicase family protein [Deltaproteobacteria bacterium]
MSFHIGQCWTSQTEPELGLGFIQEVTARTISIFFEASHIQRTYHIQSAPLQRVRFHVGDQIHTSLNETIRVEKVDHSDGLFIYHGNGKSIPETLLSAQISFSQPAEKIFSGHTDPLSHYQLRQKALQLHQKILSSPARGLIGPRVELLPHQLYVASQIIQRAYPRVLLSDEVGLGKTIEAGLILHQMLITGTAQRVLIAVPEALTNQWFVELYRRYNLSFGVIGSEEDFYETQDIFEQRQLHIISIEFLCQHQEAAKQACQASWDLLIVDEAHHLEYKNGQASPAFALIENISKQAQGLLLLTATPEQLGLEGHFSRLQLLDPDRFYSYETFLQDVQKYQSLATMAASILENRQLPAKEKDKKLNDLVDQHGTGRIFIRNTRKSIASSYLTFPKRIACPHPLHAKKSDENVQTKLEWLLTYLRQHPQKKFLLTCKYKKDVLMIEEYLRCQGFVKQITFHQDMTLLTRDRNAAYFAEENGAQIMICSEIGSEGRNFQFAHDLILFDLPQDPDVLEQRIGRLDRIGQKQNISIHIPFIQSSIEQLWFRFYHDGFQAFELSPSGAHSLIQQVKPQLHEAIESIKHDGWTKNTEQKIEVLIENTKQAYQSILQILEHGRDRLVEFNSYRPAKAQETMQLIHQVDQDSQLQDFLSSTFDLMHVHEEDLDATSYFITPGDGMFTEHFPHLPPQGVRITYDRQTALVRQDTSFMSWDHPMLIGVLDMILGQSYGNVSLAKWKQASPHPYPALEVQFVLTFIAPLEYNCAEFFPPTLFRVALTAEGEDVSQDWPKEKLHMHIQQADHLFTQQIKHLPRNHLDQFLTQAKEHIQKQAIASKEQYESNMRTSLEHEITRLETLQKNNGLVRGAEIQHFKNRIRILTQCSKQAELRLDSFLLIQNP